MTLLLYRLSCNIWGNKVWEHMGVYTRVTWVSDIWLPKIFLTKDFFASFLLTNLLLTSILMIIVSFPSFIDVPVIVLVSFSSHRHIWKKQLKSTNLFLVLNLSLSKWLLQFLIHLIYFRHGMLLTRLLIEILHCVCT